MIAVNPEFSSSLDSGRLLRAIFPFFLKMSPCHVVESRVFSAAKPAMSPQKNDLKTETISAIGVSEVMVFNCVSLRRQVYMLLS